MSQPRGRKPNEQRLLAVAQEAAVRRLICRHPPDELGLPFALWNRAAVCEVIRQRCGVVLAIRTVGKYLARWGFTAQKPFGAPTNRTRPQCGAGCGGITRLSWRRPVGRTAPSSGVTKPVCARTTCAAAATRREAGRRWSGSVTGEPG